VKRMKTKNNVDKVADEFNNIMDKMGNKKWIFIAIICFLLGVVWQIVLVAALIMGGGYLVHQKLKKDGKI
jgi:hypothetical protein